MPKQLAKREQKSEPLPARRSLPSGLEALRAGSELGEDRRLRNLRKSRAITSAQSQPASLLIETASEHQCARIDRWL